jgi:hypothetical protein
VGSIVDADDAVVEAAAAVLAGDGPQGTKGVRRMAREGATDVVYRVDPDAEPSDVETVEADGEFPDADAVLWRADRDLVEREVDRRDLGG